MDSFSLLNQALANAQAEWVGCAWDTQFGDRKQNLRGLRSRQARLAAQATRGAESWQWWEAYRYLEKVEMDAQRAAKLAADAVGHWQRGEVDAALVLLDRAIELEALYHPPHVYSRLRPFLVRGSQSAFSP